MSTKDKLIELMDEWANENINVTSWEDDFLSSYEGLNKSDIPDFSEKQEEVIERMYSKYIDGE